ncbi:MAG: glycosyl hydrolase [Bacillati bacterium ANGP1]|uniref:Glycosyl hydrolase n=1 Tax=Candidatus Segetimicrobium genomatis TaxID=2569760 RepID=A0A537K7M9_9BACT|nr:MAG: glycosyl hydrolase [Gammaproteobacteria bacterium]TMI91536.1 MAG: glycosyl hydrolase [Terrabacteria group bacterium ANGP1]
MRLAPKRSLHEAGWLALGACLIGGVAQPQAQHLNEERAAATNGGPAAVHVWLTTGDRTELLTHEPDLSFGAQPVAPLAIEVDALRSYQEIVGLGAALTDAAVAVMSRNLTRSARRDLIAELFGPPPGIGLSFVRIPIGASDFSERHYSLDDSPHGEPDPTLAHFSMEPQAHDLFPLLHEIRAINPRLRVVASPWSAPAWMKDSGKLVRGRLRADAYDAFAQYLLRVADAYAAAGLPLYAITVQNEPGFEPGNYPGMPFKAAARAEFIGRHLGPLFARRPNAPLILEWDHNWIAPGSPLRVLGDPAAARYIAGVAWHCYKGAVKAQSLVHAAYPDKDTYLTECSGGEWEKRWEENLAWFAGTLVIDGTRNWARGVILWNLALDEKGGPHAGGCTNCRGVVTIDSRTGSVTRNVEYYALAHASRFVRPGAHRIESTSDIEGLKCVAFRNADDGSMVVIVFNSAVEPRLFSVKSDGRAFRYTLRGRSLVTFTWATSQSGSTTDSRAAR